MGSGVSGTSEASAGNTYSSSSSQFQSTLDSVKKKNSSSNASSSRSSKSEEESRISSSEEQVNSCELPDEESSEDNNSLVCIDKEDPESLMSVMPDEPVKSLPEATSRISDSLSEAQVSDPERSDAENKLASEDPVTYAFLKELNVELDPEQSGLSQSERVIADKNPLTFGLLQYNKIKVDTNNTGAPVVTSDGKTVELTAQQKELFVNGNMSAFSNSLLANVKPDEHTQLLVAATGAARVDYTREQVDGLMARGEDRQALEVLNNNLEGAFSGAEREAVWKIAGEGHFTEEYFKGKIDEARTGYNASTRMINVGGLLLDTAEVAPDEVANIALDAIKNNYEGDWLKGTKNAHNRETGASDGSRLYQGISALVEKAPDRASGVASWMTDSNGGGSSLLNKLDGKDFDAVIHAAENGHGVTLSNAINTNLKAAADKNPEDEGLIWNSDSKETNRYEEFNEQFEEAKQTAGRQWYSQYAKSQFDEFNANPEDNAQGFFDAMQGDQRIGTSVSVTNDTELRNIIGKSMGYVPENETSALENDYSQDWYAEGSEQRKNIDLVAGWIKNEGGDGLQVKSMPFIYASENAGVSKGALFEVTSKDGDTVVVDGSMADDVIAANGGETVSPDDDTDLPWKYNDVEDFFDDNLLDPDGKIYMAKGDGLADADGDGSVDIESRAAADTTAWEHVSPWVDTAAGVVGVVGGVVLAIPTAGTSLGISAGAATLLVGGSMAYGLVRSTQELHDMSSHGQEYMTLGNQRARGAWLGIVATGFGAGSISSTMRASSLMTRATGTFANASSTSAQFAKGMQLTKSAQNWYRAGATSGYAGAAIGFEQMGEQGHALVTQWDNMTSGERALTFMNFSLGFADVGIGAYGHAQQKKGASQEQQNRRTVVMDEIHNEVAMEIISKGNELPEVYGSVSALDDNKVLFTPSDGTQSRVVELDNISDTQSQTNTNDDGVADNTDPVDGDKTTTDQAYETLQSLAEKVGEDPAEFAKPDVDDDNIQNTTEDLNQAETTDKADDIPEDADHEFENYDFTPDPDSFETGKKSFNRKVDDTIGDVQIFLRRGGQNTFQGKYRILREKVVNKYDAAVSQTDGSDVSPGSFDPNKLPNYGEFKADDNVVLLARIPEGLSSVANDIHVHSMGYDRRSGEYFVSLLSKAGTNSRLLLGSIPQFCGGDAHYSSPAPHKGTLRKAQMLDDRVATDFYALISAGKNQVTDKKGNALGAGIVLAAKADLSLTGFDFSAKGTQDVVAYGRHHLLENPGLFPFSGELTGKKENVGIQMGPFAWDMTSKKFQAHLKSSSETGQGVLLHYDWGLPAVKETGGKSGVDTAEGNLRIDAAKTDYEHFDEIVGVLGKEEYRDVNIVMAHTGLGRYVRPDAEIITAPVTVRDLKGNVVETKEVTAARHIHKLYEFFDKVPNARADISWSDVMQAYSDSPKLREGLVDFVIDNQNRLIFGSDTVMPDTRAQYNQALNVGISMMADIAKRDRGALWKLIRGNYDTVVDNSRSRVMEWTRGELQKQGRFDDIVRMDKMHATLDYYRQQMSSRAEESYNQWADTVDEIAARNHFERRRRPGVYPYLYESLPPAKKQEWFDQYYGESHHAHNHGHDHAGHTHDGVGTSGGKVQGDKPTRKKIFRDGAATGVASTLAAGGLSTLGVPADVAGIVNMSAFATRNASSLAQVNYQERYRQLWKDVFGREFERTDYRITEKRMNMFMGAIIENQKGLGISDEDMLRAYGAAGQFWANYNMIKNIKVTPETEARGWTREQQYHAASAEINKFQITLDRELGFGAASLDMWDVRGKHGKIANYLALGTFVINDAATAAWFAQNGVDFSTWTSGADTAMHGLFGAGNMAATWYHGWMAAGGRKGVSPVNFDMMKTLRTAYTTLFTGAAAAWTVTDVLNYAQSVGLGNIGAIEGGAGAANIVLDAALTAGLFKLNRHDIKGLAVGDMGEPHPVHVAKTMVFGALFMRTAIEAGLIAYRSSQEEKEEEKKP